MAAPLAQGVLTGKYDPDTPPPAGTRATSDSMSSAIARKVVQSFSRTDSAKSELETLSPREQSVLALLTKGFLYKEIAESLGVSVPTVSTYIRRIYEKLQVRSRSQAIAKYLRQ